MLITPDNCSYDAIRFANTKLSEEINKNPEFKNIGTTLMLLIP